MSDTQEAEQPEQQHGPKGTITRRDRDGNPQTIETNGESWSEQAEKKFLDELACSCNVGMAAEASGFSKTTVYWRRRTSAAFAEKWQAALEQGYARLELELVRAAHDSLVDADFDAERPIPRMTAKEALNVLQLHTASVKGGDAKRAGWRPRRRSIAEVRASILRKIEAIEKMEEADIIEDQPDTNA